MLTVLIVTLLVQLIIWSGQNVGQGKFRLHVRELYNWKTSICNCAYTMHELYIYNLLSSVCIYSLEQKMFLDMHACDIYTT